MWCRCVGLLETVIWRAARGWHGVAGAMVPLQPGSVWETPIAQLTPRHARCQPSVILLRCFEISRMGWGGWGRAGVQAQLMSLHWGCAANEALMPLCWEFALFSPKIRLWEAGFVEALLPHGAVAGPRRRGHPAGQEMFVLCQQDERRAARLPCAAPSPADGLLGVVRALRLGFNNAGAVTCQDNKAHGGKKNHARMC